MFMAEDILDIAEKGIFQLSDKAGKLRAEQLIYGQEDHPSIIEKPIQRPDYDKMLLEVHVFNQMTYCIDGECMININKKQYRIKKGDYCVIGYGNEHFETFYKPDIGYTLLWLSAWTPRVLCVNISKYKAGLLTVYCNLRFKINRRIFGIFQDHYGVNEDNDAKLRINLKEMFTFLKKSIKSRKYVRIGLTRDDFAGRSLKEKRIETAKEYIDKHYKEEISLKNVSKMAGLAPQYFSYLFKEVWGYPPYDYVMYLRLEEAGRLIRYSDLNISQIGSRVGYDSIYAFSRVFKKYVGKSPSDYRKDILTSEFMGFSSQKVY